MVYAKTFKHYIAGLADARGSFLLSWRQEYHRAIPALSNEPLPTLIKSHFTIRLRGRGEKDEDDYSTLLMVQQHLSCGFIRRGVITSGYSQCGTAYHYCSLTVSSIADAVTKIIPFFDNYQLYSSTRKKFEIWRDGIILFDKVRRRRRYLKTLTIPWTGKELEEMDIIIRLLQDA